MILSRRPRSGGFADREIAAILVSTPEDSRGVVHSDFRSDHSMACRLERAEATANARFVGSARTIGT